MFYWLKASDSTSADRKIRKKKIESNDVVTSMMLYRLSLYIDTTIKEGQELAHYLSALVYRELVAMNFVPLRYRSR